MTSTQWVAYVILRGFTYAVTALAVIYFVHCAVTEVKAQRIDKFIRRRDDAAWRRRLIEREDPFI